jgi:hypothetical protein
MSKTLIMDVRNDDYIRLNSHWIKLVLIVHVRRISFVYSCTMLGLVNLAKARKGGFIYVKSLV